MILAFILAQLDEELALLHQLRAIVAALETPAVLASPLQSQYRSLALPPDVAPRLPEPVPSPVLIVEPPPVSQVRPRQRTSGLHIPRYSKHPTPAPRALTNAIPAGPVMVSAAVLQEQEAKRKLLQEKIAETPALDPEALSRELSQRWGTGTSAA